MGGTTGTVLAIILQFVGLPVLILWIIDRGRNRKRLREHPAASQIAERQAHERRILNPDWACVERRTQRPAPQALRDLYGDRALITRRDLPYADDYVISTFEALDEQAIQDATRWLSGNYKQLRGQDVLAPAVLYEVGTDGTPVPVCNSAERIDG